MNAIAATEVPIMPDDLLAMPEGKDFELVDGQLMGRNMGSESSWVGGMIFHLMLTHSQAHGLGWVWPADNGYRCFPHAPGRVRRPDASFIRTGRLPGERPPSGFVPIPPDLAVEVVSPNDLASDLNAKVSDYLQAGVRLIWIIDPGDRSIVIHRPDGSAARLGERDALSGEDVLPDFTCEVRSLFPPEPVRPGTSDA